MAYNVREQVGYLILKEETVFTRESETACNFDKIAVPPGEYPVFRCPHIRGRVKAALPGILIKAHYINRLFSSISVHDDEPMTSDVFYWGAYGFEWEEMVTRGDAKEL